jgi:hypothetical protein
VAAPRGAVHTPKSGILAGRSFVGTPGTTQAYNRYQQARSHALGFASYSEQRKARSSPAFRGLITSEQKKSGKKSITGDVLDKLLKAFSEHGSVKQVQRGPKRVKGYSLDVDFSDHTVGGSYDKYLQAIGRRTGNEEWLPGETP